MDLLSVWAADRWTKSQLGTLILFMVISPGWFEAEKMYMTTTSAYTNEYVALVTFISSQL